MPTGTPRGLARRVALLVLVSATLIGTTIAVTSTKAQTPPAEGRIRLIPAMSDVAGDAGTFSVYVLAENVQHNGAITYDVNRDGTPDRSVPSLGMAAFQITVDYDPAVLTAGGVQPGPDLGRTGRLFQCLPPDRKPGKITFGCLSSGNQPAGAQGTMTLAIVQFVPQAPGLSPLALDAELAGPLGDSVSVTVDGGAARVSGVVAGPTPDPGSSSPAAATEPAASETRLPGNGTPVSTEVASTQTAKAAATATSVASKATPSIGPGPNGTNGGGGGVFDNTALWSAIVGGSIGAGGLLMLAGMVWRQRQQRSGI